MCEPACALGAPEITPLPPVADILLQEGHWPLLLGKGLEKFQGLAGWLAIIAWFPTDSGQCEVFTEIPFPISLDTGWGGSAHTE